jgi:ATP synthase protein I
MTTAPQTTRSGPRSGAVGPVVRVALGATLVLGVAATVLGAVTGGAAAALGAVIGTVMVCVFFATGAYVLDVVAALAPAASLLVALLTYTLKVVLIGLVFVALNRSGLLEDSVDARWLGGTVIAGTLTWLAAQVVASTRVRIPVYELGDSKRSEEGLPEASGAEEAGER